MKKKVAKIYLIISGLGLVGTITKVSIEVPGFVLGLFITLCVFAGVVGMFWSIDTLRNK